MKIKDVTSSAVEEAMQIFDAQWRGSDEYSGWEGNKNYTYAINHKGQLYPPKKIISIATGMPVNTFYGGRPSNTYLESRGFTIVELDRADSQQVNKDGPFSGLLKEIETEGEGGFHPGNQEDARERTLRSVVQRRGQPQFRADLIKAFDGKCAISGCDVVAVLEAAHITPYLGPATNTITNGLLLRADIHTLWDLGFVAVDPEELTVWVSPILTAPMYRALDGSPLFMPPQKHHRPSMEALQAQWDNVRRFQ